MFNNEELSMLYNFANDNANDITILELFNVTAILKYKLKGDSLIAFEDLILEEEVLSTIKKYQRFVLNLL